MKTRRGTLNLLAFVSGGAVIILEVLGTRLIGPFYGVTLYVWAALIFVTLVSLAVGYQCGGLLADRRPAEDSPFFVALGAAAAVRLIPSAAPAVLQATDVLGVRWGSLLSAAILFGPALFLLAMVSPCAVRLCVRSLDEVGATVGSLYAISTAGSCVGILLVAYILLPRLSTTDIIYLLCGALSALCGIYFLVMRRFRIAACAGLVLLTSLWPLVEARQSPKEGEDGYRLLYRAESIYGRIQVVEDQWYAMRWLMADCSVVGGEYTSGETVYPFLRMVEAVRYLRPAGRRALQVGLGTGAVAKLLTAAGIRTDVVEIDPNIVHAARTYFAFTPNGTFTVEDGREFLRRATGRYDFVIHDTFSGGTVPFHLISREAFADIRRILADDGVLCLVLVGFFSGERGMAAHAVYRTLAEVFPHVRVVVDPDNSELPSNLLFFASPSPLDWTPESWKGLTLGVRTALAKQQKNFAGSKGHLITDDRNALDAWLLDSSEAYRRWIIGEFPSRFLLY